MSKDNADIAVISTFLADPLQHQADGAEFQGSRHFRTPESCRRQC